MSMMSEQSKQALAEAFSRAARVGLVRAPEDAFEIVPIADLRFDTRPGESVLVITTSSFSFRLLTIFHIAATPESRAYYGSGAADTKGEAAFSEIVNLCCGALNRELSHHFPHLGMSIPYSLGNSCLGCLDELKPEYLSRYAITVDRSVRLEATLCMCCSAPVEVVARTDVAAEKTGELELF
jgi:hypothetical protein